LLASITDIRILPFTPEHQHGVEKLVLPIQRIEFGFDVTREQQPDLMDIAGVFQKGDGNFWIAVHDDRVIGSIGIVDISNSQVALKKMFVDATFRGKELGIAQSLLQTVFDWCKQRSIKQIYLGTTAPMHAAHRFYEKNGFIEVRKNELPPEFPIVFVDTKFYQRDL
jgi:GNAT superfamily N-acetyltransferase